MVFGFTGNPSDRVLQDIQNTRWQGSTPPIGPLGRYVSLKDGAYRDVLQNQIGNSMYQFVVSHAADRHRLGDILRRHSKFVYPYSRTVTVLKTLLQSSTNRHCRA